MASRTLDVWQHRKVVRHLVRRDLKVKYQNSILGYAWSMLEPLAMACVYYFVFGVVIRIHDDMPNFAIHLFTGIVFVHYFSETWSGGTRWSSLPWMISNGAVILSAKFTGEIS